MSIASRTQLSLPHSEVAAFAQRIARNLAPHDVVVLGFELYLWLRAQLIPYGPGALYARNVSFGLLASTAVVIGLCRGELLPPGPARALLHRLGLALPMAGVYLALRRYLPALGLQSCDPLLLALDRRLFGETPAVWLERFASRGAVEWFALCYYGYFFLIGGYVGLTLLRDREARAQELMLGIALVTAVGQSAYTLVPGHGPHAVAGLFMQPLAGGANWARVLSVVARAGAGLDIFPSLHTAHPLLLALHSLRHRRSGVYRWLWLPTAVLAANMIVSTVFLRWHYGVDVLAGALLAVTMHRIAIATVRAEGDRPGRQPAFETLPLVWPIRAARRPTVAPARRRPCG